jgi:hypothetical protein
MECSKEVMIAYNEREDRSHRGANPSLSHWKSSPFRYPAPRMGCVGVIGGPSPGNRDTYA